MAKFKAPKMIGKPSVRDRNRALQAKLETLNEQFQAVVQTAGQVTLLLYAVLAQKGGEVVVTAGTFKQVQDDFQFIQYGLDTSTENEMKVVLVDTREALPETDLAPAPPAPKSVVVLTDAEFEAK